MSTLFLKLILLLALVSVQAEKFTGYFSAQWNVNIDVQTDLVNALDILDDLECIFACNREQRCFSCAAAVNAELQTNCYLFGNSTKTASASSNSTVNLYTKFSSTTVSSTSNSTPTTVGSSSTSNPTTIVASTVSSTTLTTATTTTTTTVTTTTTTVTFVPPEPDYTIFFINGNPTPRLIVGYGTTVPQYPTYDTIVLTGGVIRNYLADDKNIYSYSQDWLSFSLIYTFPTTVFSIVIVNQDVYVAMFDRLLKTTANFTTQVQVMRNSTNEEFFRIHYDRLNDQILVSIFATTGNSSVRTYDRNLAWIGTLQTDSTERLAIYTRIGIIYTADKNGQVKQWINNILLSSYTACSGSVAISISVDDTGSMIVACKATRKIFLYDSNGASTGNERAMSDDPSLAKFDRNGKLIVTSAGGKLYEFQ